MPRAAILAGGPGTTLLPIANLLPKLAFPVANEPLIKHLTRFLLANGVTDVAVVGNSHLDDPLMQERLQHLAEAGTRLQFFTDPGPRGTAGSLHQLQEFSGATPLLVIEGGVFAAGLDLRDLFEVHRERRAGLTMLVGPQRPCEPYAEHLRVGGDDRIHELRTVFHYPRSESGVRSRGIYILDPQALSLVPAQGYMDLKEQLVPLLNEHGIPVCASRAGGYVRPIGDIGDYFAVNKELLSASELPRNGNFGRQIAEDVWAGPGAEVAPNADIVGPVILGPNSRVGSGARIVGPTTIGEGVRIGRNAVVRESILWPQSRVSDEAQVVGSLVGQGCEIPGDRHFDNVVVVDSTEHAQELSFLSRLTDVGHGTLFCQCGKITPTTRRSVRNSVFAGLKRTLDVVGAFIAIVLTAPLFLIVALAIKLDSGGSVFFRQRRCGYRGRTFSMYKFRTMRPDAEQQQEELAKRKDVDGPTFKIFGDPRVTRVGRLLRRSSLDELPQLINVLKGDMSLVGPRPLVRGEMRCAPSWRDIRLQVKPGITGLWQVSARGTTSFEYWVRYDTNYVKHQSMLLDLKILLLTLVVVLRGNGAE
ncbi:MAG: sugar transferase [Phycisphaerales bacterium]|nr:MAG: sugar transferase [Phycisphaerales bacterium]